MPVRCVVLLAALAAAGLAAQPPAIQWVRTFSALDCAQGYWVEPTSDGGFVSVGTTGRGGGPVESWLYYMVKVDSLGGLEWERTFGQGDARCVRQTRDGGFILSGRGRDSTVGVGVDPGGLGQPYVVKTDSTGTLQWKRVCYVDTFEYGYAVVETYDRGYVLLASNPGFDSGMVLFKLDSSGAVEWQRAYLGSGYWTEYRCIDQTADSGFVVGWTHLVRLSPNGILLWRVQHEYVAQANSVCLTHDGGFVATGPGYWRHNQRCSSDVYLLKVDSAGGFQWRRKWGGGRADAGYAVRQTADRGYAIVAHVGESKHDCVLRTDSLGNALWTVQLRAGTWSEASSVCVARDGGLVVAGAVPDSADGESRLCLWKLAPEGK